jgi:hypothetical protein
LDTGVVAASTWYYAYAIMKADGTKSFVASLSSTAPTLPATYLYYARVGSFRTDATANKYPFTFKQAGAFIQYAPTAGTNLTTMRQMASGAAASPTAVAVGAFVPPTADSISISVYAAASNTSYAGPNIATTSGTTTSAYLGAQAGTGGPVIIPVTFVLESTNIYWGASGGGSICCTGYYDSI